MASSVDRNGDMACSLGSTNVPAPARERPDPRRFKALAVLAITQLMIALDVSIVTIALPSAQAALHVSVADRQWVLTAYTILFGGLLLLGGRIADYLGRKRVLLWGLLGFAAASALGGLAQDEAMLLIARALQGALAALMAPAALSLINVTFTEGRERARAFGVYGAVSGAGSAIGLILGGILVQYASWRWTLLVNVPIAIAVFFGAARVVTESRTSQRTGYDVLGAVISTVGLVGLVYGFSQAATSGWGSPGTLASVAAGAVLLAVFILVETRVSSPLLPLRVVFEKVRGGSFLGLTLGGMGTLSAWLFLTYYFQQVHGYSAVVTGLCFPPLSLAIISASTITTRLDHTDATSETELAPA